MLFIYQITPKYAQTANHSSETSCLIFIKSEYKKGTTKWDQYPTLNQIYCSRNILFYFSRCVSWIIYLDKQIYNRYLI